MCVCVFVLVFCLFVGLVFGFFSCSSRYLVSQYTCSGASSALCPLFSASRAGWLSLPSLNLFQDFFFPLYSELSVPRQSEYINIVQLFSVSMYCVTGL